MTIVPPEWNSQSMNPPPRALSAPFRVGAKGRVVLPAAVRRAANIAEGAEVVARPEGEGRVVIETVHSIRERVWGAAPDASGLDTTTDVRAMRDDDNHVSDDAFARRVAIGVSETESAAAGAALLARLGL